MSDTITAPDKLQRIRELNDALRSTLQGGKVLITSTVQALPVAMTAQALQYMRTFDRFTGDNDPHGEHDCATFSIGNKDFLWKIDYYDRSLQYGSEDPADPVQTTRVLTLMLAEDY